MLNQRTLIRLCRARDSLREHHVSVPSIHEVAKDAQMSLCHFIRRFEAVFGETPHQLRTRERLNRAKQLLAFSDYSVTDVCMEIGFTSLSSFSDLFTRRVGAAPSAYRRQIRSRIHVPEALERDLFPGCLTLMTRLPADCAIFEKRPNSHAADSASHMVTTRVHV